MYKPLSTRPITSKTSLGHCVTPVPAGFVLLCFTSCLQSGCRSFVWAVVEAALNCEVLHHEQLSVRFCFSGVGTAALCDGDVTLLQSSYTSTIPTEVPAHGDVAALKAELCLIGLNGRSKEICLEDEGVRQTDSIF